ncbi:alcohol dehydrogenase catalytic domain-containing protein [Nocardioides fonticola]|uniref:Alcohol dehydrogenase catalytic domain-containing protein n=1 Tax=Nocardioides fonticola TaxID=450363 RepID=A0ABP7XGZ3_9ACTN
MLTAAYAGHQTMTVLTAEPRPPGPGEVQIRVAYVGLCGTDLHVLHGAMDHRVTTPAVIGHEMSGTVAAVGAGVEGWAPGDPLTVMPLVWDGTCPACRAGHRHICQHLSFVGIDEPGALQEYWTVPADLLVPLAPGIALREAALVEPLAVAVHDVGRSGLAAGETAVVLGGGPIGMLIAAVARHQGARVLLSEPDPARRADAEAWGFETLDPRADGPDGDLAGRVDRLTDGAGADVVFEVSGAPAAVLNATAIAKVRGTVVIVAIHPRPVPVDLQRVFWRELRILGARVYEREDFTRAVQLLADGTVPASRLISRVVPLDAVAEGFASLESGQAMKVLVQVGAEA